MRERVENFFLWKWFLSIERFLMIFNSIAVVLTIATNVVCRYVLHINFAGSDEILIIFALWLYFIGGLYGNYEDIQIKADVLSIMVKKESVLRIFNIIQKAIALAVSIVLAVWAYQYLTFCLKVGGYTAVFHLPMLLSRGALVFGYMAPILYNVYHLLLAIFEKEPPKTAEEIYMEKNLTGGGAE